MASREKMLDWEEGSYRLWVGRGALSSSFPTYATTRRSSNIPSFPSFHPIDPADTLGPARTRVGNYLLAIWVLPAPTVSGEKNASYLQRLSQEGTPPNGKPESGRRVVVELLGYHRTRTDGEVGDFRTLCSAMASDCVPTSERPCQCLLLDKYTERLPPANPDLSNGGGGGVETPPRLSVSA
ncbi:hypothetical protein K438DRAFT_1788367 [Mycena galopus ATCC 62051]|nr:hypothetical protein K438DRAFT_1788367 [Mycena galopus ATCC 62051]